MMPHWFAAFLLLLALALTALLVAVFATAWGLFCLIRWIMTARRADRFAQHLDIALGAGRDRTDADVIAEYEAEFLPDYRRPPAAIADSYLNPKDFRWTN